MGLSSSQARLLTLTGRMHDIEYKAQKLEAQKLMLANETRQVYEEYLNVLDSTVIQNKILASDGSISYTDTTYNKLVGTKINDNTIYILRELESGKAYVDEEFKCAFDCSNKTLGGFLKTYNDIKSGSSNSYVSISSAEQLKSLSNSNGNYKLECDITVSDWSGISNFSGNFDGNGHTITIESGTNGLFASTNGATISNVNVDANIYDSASNMGALIGTATNTTIKNSSTTGSLTGDYMIGGLVGYTKGVCEISNCESSVNVYSKYVSPSNGYAAEDSNDFTSYAGGLIGYAGIISGGTNNLTINDCVTHGDVNTEYWIAGGFIGYTRSDMTLNNCVSYSNVCGNYSGKGDLYKELSGKPTVAAFNCGTNKNATVYVNNCSSYGKVSANGDPERTGFDDYVWSTKQPVFNNFYSTLKNSAYSTPVENVYTPDTNPSSYPNLTTSDVEKAISIFNILEKTNGGVCVPENLKDSAEWFSNVVLGGYAMISQVNLSKEKEFSIYDVSVATDTNLQEAQNKKNLRKAEAKYEADMKRIDLKDRKYDTDLAALDTERNAIKQEIDTLNTIAKDNVERTFKLFS